MAPRFRHHFSGAAALLSSLSSCLCRSSRAKLKRPKIIISDVELNKCMFYKRSTVSNTNAKRVVVDIAPSHLRPNQGPQEGVQNWLVKFGHSEKNTKFEKIFHLKFDVTQQCQILGGRFFFQILCSSQNVQTLPLLLNIPVILHRGQPT